MRFRLTRRAMLAAPLAAAVPPAMAQTPGSGTLERRWLPVDPGATLERIAFGSCLHQRRPQPIWRAVRAADPQLFLMLGDNVYGDVSDASLNEMREAYKVQAAHPELAEIRRAVPFLATWDDHDFGLNDASAAFPHKAATRALFAEFWELPASALPSEGIYRSVLIGPAGRRVQIILLDLRTFRSEFRETTRAEREATPGLGKFRPDADPAKTMLGERQWSWLAEELRRPAELRLVVSSIQVIETSLLR